MYKKLISAETSDTPMKFSCECGMRGRFYFKNPHDIIDAFVIAARNTQPEQSLTNTSVSNKDVYWALVQQTPNAKPLQDLTKHFGRADAPGQLYVAIEEYRTILTKSGKSDLKQNGIHDQNTCLMATIDIVGKEMKKLNHGIVRLGKLGLLRAVEADIPKFH